jgi:hypothetical protein
MERATTSGGTRVVNAPSMMLTQPLYLFCQLLQAAQIGKDILNAA